MMVEKWLNSQFSCNLWKTWFKRAMEMFGRKKHVEKSNRRIAKAKINEWIRKLCIVCTNDIPGPNRNECLLNATQSSSRWTKNAARSDKKKANVSSPLSQQMNPKMIEFTVVAFRREEVQETGKYGMKKLCSIISVHLRCALWWMIPYCWWTADVGEATWIQSNSLGQIVD